MAKMISKVCVWFSITFYFSLALTSADICTSNVCEYIFDVRHAISMTIHKGGKTYNVRLNGSQLVPLPNIYGKTFSGDVGPDDVITLDGVQRNVITMNKTIPGPTIEVMEGAQIVVKVRNYLLTKAVTIHWHGIHQKNTPWMDGMSYVTQCPILPRQSFTYRFKAYPSGTHWYHSHLVNQRNDGLYGMLIVHRRMPVMPEYSLMVSDWHHHEGDTMEILSYYTTHNGPGDLMTGPAETDYGPDNVETSILRYVSSLINGRGRYGGNMVPLSTFAVTSGGQYRFRCVNVAGERTYEVSVDNHEMNIVALDGEEIEYIRADSVVINPGERIDFIIEAHKPVSSYWIRSNTLRIGKGMYPENDGIIYGTKAILKYDGSQTDEPTTSQKVCTSHNKCKAFNCQFGGYAAQLNKECIQLDKAHSVRHPNDLADEFGLSKNADITLFLNVDFFPSGGTSINARKFHVPSMPWSEPNYKEGLVSCATEECSNEDSGCECTNIQTLPYNKTIDLVLVSYELSSKYIGHHGMHLHGHNFAVLKVGFSPYNLSTGFHSGYNSDFICPNNPCKSPRWNGQAPEGFNLVDPPIKDTILVPARGYVVVRFRSTNPGPWLFHCHVATHLTEGMTMIFNEATDHLPPTPVDFPRCHPFDWSEQEFRAILEMQQTSNTADNESRNETFTTNSEYDKTQETKLHGNSLENAKKNGDEFQDCQFKGKQVVLHTRDLAGLIIGSVAFGAAIVIIVLCLYHLCYMSQQYTVKQKH